MSRGVVKLKGGWVTGLQCNIRTPRSGSAKDLELYIFIHVISINLRLVKTIIKIVTIKSGSKNSGQGRSVDFFFRKAQGLGAALRPAVGPGQRPGWGQCRGRSPRKLLNFSDFRSKIQPYSQPLQLKLHPLLNKKYTFIDTPSMRHNFFQSNLVVYTYY